MLPPTQPDVVVYFGCVDGPGHHAHFENRRSRLSHQELNAIRDWVESLDGKLHDDHSPRWLTHWFEAVDGSQMTFIARRDNRFDKRPGSWCGFLMPGNSPLVTALRVAREAFPQHFGAHHEPC